MLDGNYGFGQTIGPQAVDIGIAKARAAGLAVVALRHSGHLGRIGDWGERAAEAGLISIHFVNVDNGPLVAPFGGTGRRFATNPVCIGIPPMAGRPMLLLDMATSVVAEGKVLVASNGGKPVPGDALIGADGKLSDDPATLYGPLVPNGPRNPANGTGAIRAFGEHKGSGLAFMCEILAGAAERRRHGAARARRGAALHQRHAVDLSRPGAFRRPGPRRARRWSTRLRQVLAGGRRGRGSAGARRAGSAQPGRPRGATACRCMVDTWTRLCALATRFGVAIPD